MFRREFPKQTFHPSILVVELEVWLNEGYFTHVTLSSHGHARLLHTTAADSGYLLEQHPELDRFGRMWYNEVRVPHDLTLDEKKLIVLKLARLFCDQIRGNIGDGGFRVFVS